MNTTCPHCGAAQVFYDYSASGGKLAVHCAYCGQEFKPVPKQPPVPGQGLLPFDEFPPEGGNPNPERY